MILQYGKPESVGMSSKRIEYLENIAESWTRKGITPSIVELVARKGVIVSHKAFGKKAPDAEHGSITADTIFPVASITKTITATSIMTLVDDGLIDLNRAVQRYIPEFSGEDKKEVKIRHLLTHTSGISDESVYGFKNRQCESGCYNPIWYDLAEKPEVAEELYLICNAPLGREPEKEMSYCGLGYRLLAEIIKRVTGKQHYEYARERIFDPLGMKDAHFIVPENLRPRVIKRDINLPFGKYFESEHNMVSTSASGGLKISAHDLAVFSQMYLNGGEYGDVRILSPIAIREMIRNHTPGIKSVFNHQYFPESSWGLGWNVRSSKYDDGGCLRSARTICHSGAGGTYFQIDPSQQLIIVYFGVVIKDPDLDTPVALNHKDLFSNCAYSAIEELL